METVVVVVRICMCRMSRPKQTNSLTLIKNSSTAYLNTFIHVFSSKKSNFNLIYFYEETIVGLILILIAGLTSGISILISHVLKNYL